MNHMKLLAILAFVLMVTISANGQLVSLREDLNVTIGGSTITDVQALSLDLGFRYLTKAVGGGRRGVATSALGVDTVTGSATVALGAAYTKSANETDPHLPLCVIAFFVQTPNECFYVPDPPTDNFNTLLSRNTIGSFPYALDEIAPNGTVVRRYNFQELAWPRTPLAASAFNEDELAVFQWRSNLTSGGSVSIAFIQSAVVGVVDFDTTPVIPKAWQTIVHISDYVFESTGNALKLEVMAATGFGVNRTVVGLISRPNTNSTLFDTAYCQMDEEATLEDGGNVTVSLTTFDLVRTPTVATLEFAPILAEQLTLRYGTFGVWRSNATFPADESTVWFQFRTAIGSVIEDLGYGPALPPSPPSKQNTSAGSTLYHPISTILILLIALYIFC